MTAPVYGGPPDWVRKSWEPGRRCKGPNECSGVAMKGRAFCVSCADIHDSDIEWLTLALGDAKQLHSELHDGREPRAEALMAHVIEELRHSLERLQGKEAKLLAEGYTVDETNAHG